APITAVVPRPERIPLSFAQQRMWFINQFDITSPAYNIPAGMRLKGEIDVASLTAAFADVVARHEVLRTRYPSDAAGPHQEILAARDAVELFDWSQADSEGDILDVATAGFDVASELPVRGRFRVVEPGVIDVVVVIHHIAFDGESTSVFLRDLLAAYLHRIDPSVPASPTPEVQYADYAIWQREVLGGHDDTNAPLSRQLAYWREQLVDLPAVTDLPMDRPRPQVQDQSGGTVLVDFDDDFAARFESLARRAGVTGFMLGHAALAIVIARLAATDDVVIGSPIAGRGDRALDELVGMFVNTLVLRTAVDPAMTVTELLARVRGVDLDSFANSEVQFEDLIEEFAAERNTSYQPLVQIAYTYIAEVQSSALASAELPGFTVEALEGPDPSAKFELMVALAEANESAPMRGSFVYETALFDEATMTRIAHIWRHVLRQIVENQDLAVGDVDLTDGASDGVTPVSRNSVGGTEPAADGGITEPAVLVDVLSTRHADPAHAALICGDAELSYGEFEDKTNRIARSLIASGTGPDDVVAVGLERSIDSVLAVFGVIKAGAAYVPVDPAYPSERIEFMLSDSGARAGITNESTRSRLGASEIDWFDVSQLVAASDSGAPLTDDDRNGRVRLDSLAYLIYTSGSTGRPKAVGVAHRGLANFVDQFREVSGTHADAPDTRVLHVASPSFDASVLEMLWALGLGHTLVIAPASDYAGAALGRVLSSHRVTDTLITPTVLGTVDPGSGHTLRHLVTGGEAVSPELVARWTEPRSERTMYNFYGPSEATVWSLTGRSETGRPVTIGHPVRGFAAYVLDARLHPVPRGVIGELYLASDDSLARGYLGRPGLTAGSFVADPFSASAGARMYATGDLVRITAEGEIEYAGRADDQVKINGQRVELGEIEAVLAAQPGVEQALALGVTDDAGRDRLVAYLVAPSDAGLDGRSVLDSAAERLAGHMLPNAVIVLSALPLTPGGKLDRRALPRPQFGEHGDDYVAPESSTEQMLAGVVAALLGLERVSVAESFFALGGDSIMSIQLASAARANGLPLSPREIFELRTVRAMACAVDEGRIQLPMLEESADDGPLSVPLARWLVDAAGEDGDLSDFSQSAVLAADPEMTVADLVTLLAAVVVAHPALSARLGGEDGASLVFGGAFDAAAAVGEHVVHAVLGTADFETGVRQAHAVALSGLDPAAGVMVRAELVRGADGACVVVVAHHLAVDAVSWPILVEDFFTGWAQMSAGQPIVLREEQTSLRAWFTALAARELSDADTAFWSARSLRPTPLGLADDESPRWSQTATVNVSIPAEIAEQVLTRVPEAFAGGVDDVLLGAFARAVRSWQAGRGIDDDAAVIVLTEGHGRYEEVLESGSVPRRADLSRTVGWFTSIAPMRLDPGVDVVHAVKAAKEERLVRPDRGLSYGLSRFAGDSPLAGTPLPSIAFNYLGGRGGTLDLDAAGEEVPAMTPWPGAPRLPGSIDGGFEVMSALTVDAGVIPTASGSVISADFRYPVAGLDEEVVNDLGARWIAEVAEAVRVTAAEDPGLSPSQVPGAEVNQDDLDALAQTYPSADVWGLSPLQRGLYFQAMVAQSAGLPDVYVVQAALRLRGVPDVERLRRAAQDLTAAHPVLRSAFVTTASGALVAAVPGRVDVPWTVVDLGDVSEAESAGYLADVKRREALERFELAAAPLLRFTVVLHGGSADVLVTAHHLVVDGWSLPLVLADLLALYTAGTTYTQRSADAAEFRDYLQLIADRDVEQGLAVWRRILSPAQSPTLVAPGAHADAECMPASVEVTVGEDLAGRLDGLARANGVTVATVLQVAWAVFLSKVTGERVVTFGETVSGRPADLVGVESVVGLFINTLPVVVDVDPEAPLSELLSGLQRDKVAVLDHHHLGLPEIVAAAEGSIGFDTLAVHESYPVDAESLEHTGDALGDLAIEEAAFTDATHYPLNMITSGDASGLKIALRYLPAAFNAGQVEVFGAVVLRVLETLVDRPETLAGDVQVLDDVAISAVLQASCGARTHVPPSTVAEEVGAQVIRAPEAEALVFAGRSVSYGEFG
ncbi:MAG: amino acid adenylation domain-containing protein, partial [Gordonia sp. (in: high G+C Gram-positive bacteria)]